MTAIPKQSLGPYELLTPIGAGGMGEVFRARDTRLNREVAIKVLPKDFAADADRLRRFDQESQTLAALNHPNILTIHDAGVQDGTPYLVSELLDGRTLRDELRGGALSLRKATDYALQIAQGLTAAHSKGIIHRDLKPENIFITKDARVKILDFGLAKLQSDLKSEIPNFKSPADPNTATMVESTEAGRILGTPAYMSPEQVRGEAVDHRTDIFAFGCVLYEMLSGARAFRRDTPIESMHAVLKEEPPAMTERNDHFPPALERMVQRCLEKQPENRFQTAKDLAFALSEISTSELTPASGPRLAGRGGRVTTVKVVLPVAVIIVLAAVAVWQPWRKAPSFSRNAPPTPPASPPAESARAPLPRARAIEAKGLDASLDELNLAISLCQRQLEQNPADAEVWALLCRLQCNDYYSFDHTPERLKAAQGAAQSALSLAPESISARLAQASVYTLEPATYSQGLEMLRQLEQLAPREPDVLKTLAWTILTGAQGAVEAPGIAEALGLYERALKLRPDDAMALAGQAWALAFSGRHEEADVVWDDSIRRTGSSWSLAGKFYDLVNNRNKPEEAEALLAKFPPDLMFNGMVVRVVTQFWLNQHQPQKALAYIEPFPGEFLEDHWDSVPKRFLMGRAHAQAGQMAAAQVEWRQALNAVNARLATQPENAHLIAYKARLHFLLGETDEAARQVELYGQLTSARNNQDSLLERMMLNLDVGRAKDAVLLIENNRPILIPNQSDLLFVRNRLRRAIASHPEFGSVPEFRDELAKLEAEAQSAETSGPSTKTARAGRL